MRTLLCLLATALISSATARADDREEARREFAAGQASDKQKDWDTAIEHYLRAYELVPHHFALYNIATDYERLGRLREAATWYTRYLDTAPDSADRDKVQRLLGELRLRPSNLIVRSTPPGAKLTIDGNPHGVTPFTGSLRGGGHRIAVDSGGSREERDVTLEYGEPQEVLFTLRAAPAVRGPGDVSGGLHLTGLPVGALVTVDGIPSGSLPVRLSVTPGTHTVRISQHGYLPYETTVEVIAHQDTPITAKLENSGIGPESPPTKLAIGYLLGLAVGVDLQGSGEMVLGELGGRLLNFYGSVRAGSVGDTVAVELLVRWAFTRNRLAPFVGVGYTFASGGSGYEIMTGLRYDVLQGDKVGIALLVEGGLRYQLSGDIVQDDGPGGTSSTGTGLIIPLLASVQLLYR